MNLRQKSVLLVLLGMVGSLSAQELQPTGVVAVQGEQAPRFEVKRVEKQVNTRAALPVEQKKSFEGWAVFGSIGYSMNKMKYSAYKAGDSSKESDMAYQVGVEYGIPVGENFITTIGGSYSLNNIEFEKINLENANIVDAELKSRFSFYVAPGYKLTPDWLVYGKVSYQHAKGTYSDNYVPLGGVKFGKGEKTFSGIGYGLGTAITVFPNLENSVEVQHISYDKQQEFISSGKPTATEVTASLKYRF